MAEALCFKQYLCRFLFGYAKIPKPQYYLLFLKN